MRKFHVFFFLPPLCQKSCGVFKEYQSFAATGPRANTFWQQADEWTEPRGGLGSWRLEVQGGERGRSGSEINVLWLASESINQSRGGAAESGGMRLKCFVWVSPYGPGPASSVSVTGSFIYSCNQHSTVVVAPSSSGDLIHTHKSSSTSAATCHQRLQFQINNLSELFRSGFLRYDIFFFLVFFFYFNLSHSIVYGNSKPALIGKTTVAKEGFFSSPFPSYSSHGKSLFCMP